MQTLSQKTLSAPVRFEGVGLHSGQMINLEVCPAAPHAGIKFFRTDVPAAHGEIPALWNNVTDTMLCTVIGNDHGTTVGTIEHLMAALRGLGIDNALIKLDGPEVPVMDGSSITFVQAFERIGLIAQGARQKAIRVLKEVNVGCNGKSVTLSPASFSRFSAEIDFDHPSIGKQTHSLELLNGNFVHNIADCRTFGFLHEVEMMRAQGLARGGSLENAIVLDHESVLNSEGLRRKDEFIRHKILDAIGDLYLAGAPIIGHYHGVKAGHRLNNEILHALFSDTSAWTHVHASAEQESAPAGNLQNAPLRGSEKHAQAL